MDQINPIDIEFTDEEVMFMDQLEPMDTDSEEEEESSNNECSGYVFIDMIGFDNHDRDHFICKEFALIADDFEYHAIIKSPYNFNKLPLIDQQMSICEINNLHGLKYEDGNVHLTDVIQTVYPYLMGKTIILEDSYKIKMLQYMFRNCGELICININHKFDMDYRSKDKDEYPICSNHTEIFDKTECECALTTVQILKEVIKNNLKLLEIWSISPKSVDENKIKYHKLKCFMKRMFAK